MRFGWRGALGIAISAALLWWVLKDQDLAPRAHALQCGRPGRLAGDRHVGPGGQDGPQMGDLRLPAHKILGQPCRVMPTDGP